MIQEIIQNLIRTSASGWTGTMLVIVVAGVIVLAAWHLFDMTNGDHITSYGTVVKRTNGFTIGIFGISVLAFICAAVVVLYSTTGRLECEITAYRYQADMDARNDFNSLMPQGAADSFREIRDEAENVVPMVLNSKGEAGLFLLSGTEP